MRHILSLCGAISISNIYSNPGCVADSTFVGFNALEGAAGAVARLSNNASLFLDNCNLQNNTLAESRGVIYLDRGSRASGPSRVAVSGGAHTVNEPAGVPLVAVHSDGTVYATPALDVWNEGTGEVQQSLAIDSIQAGTFVTGDDEAFKQLQAVLYPDTRAAITC